MIDRSADWHTHSDVTDGADPPADMADAALAAGLRTWGLSDHVRADTTWLPDYVRTVRALRRDGLLVQCGVEAKMLDTTGRLDLPARLPRLDYVLVADHQVPGPAGPRHPAAVAADLAEGRLAASDVLDDLIAATVAGVRGSPVRPILAHLFSVLPKIGLSEDDVTDEHLAALASGCLEAGAAVEANEKWACPSPRILHALHRAGVPLTAGSDAHRVADVGRWSYLDTVTGTDPADLGPAVVANADSAGVEPAAVIGADRVGLRRAAVAGADAAGSRRTAVTAVDSAPHRQPG